MKDLTNREKIHIARKARKLMEMNLNQGYESFKKEFKKVNWEINPMFRESLFTRGGGGKLTIMQEINLSNL